MWFSRARFTKKRMKQKAGQLLFFIYGWTSKNTKRDHHLRQRGLFSHQGQLCSLFGPHHDMTSGHKITKTSSRRLTTGLPDYST